MAWHSDEWKRWRNRWGVLDQDKTDTHIRCSACREWKPHSQYRAKMRKCNDCLNQYKRDWYRRKSSEDLDDHLSRKHQKQRERRLRRRSQRIEDCQVVIGIFRRAGLSYRAIGQRSGVNRDAIAKIERDQVKFVLDKTRARLLAAWEAWAREQDHGH